MKDPKPCKFCDKGAVHAPIKEMERHGASVFFCHDCNAEYIYFFDGTCASTSLYTEINHKTFRWTVTSIGTGAIYHIVEPGIPGVRKNGQSKPIKYFDPRKGQRVQELTPQNINEKLRVWLLFL